MAQAGSEFGAARRAKRVSRRLGLSVHRGQIVALVVVVVLVCCGIGLRFATMGSGTVIQRAQVSDESASVAEDNLATTSETFVVHVDGAVASPGVYELKGCDLRVNDAIQAAGGLLDTAVTDVLNLASLLVDGQKVHVPSAEETSSSVADASLGTSAGLVNINTASVEQLTSLSGVGDSTASAIVKEREANGPFSSIEDIMRVSGIGEKKFEKIKDSICV